MLRNVCVCARVGVALAASRAARWLHSLLVHVVVQMLAAQPSGETTSGENATTLFMRASAMLVNEDNAAIDGLFESYRCKHVYLDMGTNTGVQIRKLFERKLYPRARVMTHYKALFGPTPWCRVCAIGFEPNPEHAQRLDQLQHSLRAAGAPVHIFRAATSDALATMSFQSQGGEAPWVRSLHLNAGAKAGASAYEAQTPSTAVGHVTVRTLDLARIVHRVHSNLRRINGGSRGESRILMKLDIEGGEERLLFHLARTQTLCLIDRVMVEWHRLDLHMPWLRDTAKLSPTMLRNTSRDQPSASGVAAVTNLTYGLRKHLLEVLNAGAADCRTDLMAVDDETFYRDGRPLPTNQTVPCVRPAVSQS